MIDIALIRETPEQLRDALSKRGESVSVVDEILSLDTQRRTQLQDSEALRLQRNQISKAMGQIKDTDERAQQQAKVKAIKQDLSNIETQLAQIQSELDARLNALPNIPSEATPVGASEDENVILSPEITPPVPAYPVRPHWELTDSVNRIDFDQGVKLCGSRFYVLHGDFARLQRALIAYLLQNHSDAGYHETLLPVMVHESVVYASGQLPKFRDNLYKDHESNIFFAPTAEVPLTSLYAKEVLTQDALPQRLCAYSPCFRREKASAGRDVRGIKRGHQFDKVELYTLCSPEQAAQELDHMKDTAVHACEALGLSYRVKQLCTGDLGFAAQTTFDIEVWAPGCQEWLEVSSVSHCGDFQARRAHIKYRSEVKGKANFLHTLNGSGLGIPRTMIAILEQYQRPDHWIEVPSVLQSFMQCERIALKPVTDQVR